MKINRNCFYNLIFMIIFSFQWYSCSKINSEKNIQKTYQIEWIGSLIVYKMREQECKLLSDQETSISFKYRVINFSKDTLLVGTGYSFFLKPFNKDTIQMGDRIDDRTKILPQDTIIYFTGYVDKPWDLTYENFREYYVDIFKSAKLIYKPKNIDSLKKVYKNLKIIEPMEFKRSKDYKFQFINQDDILFGYDSTDTDKQKISWEWF